MQFFFCNDESFKAIFNYLLRNFFLDKNELLKNLEFFKLTRTNIAYNMLKILDPLKNYHPQTFTWRIDTPD